MTLLLRAELEKWIANEIVWHARPGTHAYRILGKLQEAINSNTFTAQADGDTIKSETNCPTCGSAVKVGGDGETHYYIPITPSTGLVGDWLPSEVESIAGLILLRHHQYVGYRVRLPHDDESSYMTDKIVRELFDLSKQLADACMKLKPQPPSRPTEVEGE